jgi:predicted site-specific integrase-resolvase
MYVKPKQASKFYNVSENTLRTWSSEGRIKYSTTQGGHRRYFIEEKPENGIVKPERTKIIYSRVSSGKQRDDLERQSDFLRQKYPEHKLITDIGSGINFQRPGFKKILENVFNGTIQEVVVAHKDRFTRFGYDLFEWIFKQHNSELICDSESKRDDQSELSEDLMSIVTVFTAKYYGTRKYKDKKQLLSKS